MMICKPFLVAMTCVVLAAGCNRNTEPEANAVPEVAPDLERDPSTAPPAAPQKPFMIKAFAGTFSANGSTITLNADGTYTSKIGDATSDGTWTADPMGTELLLDPTSKAEVDGKYAVISNNEISALDGGTSLQREGAAQ